MKINFTENEERRVEIGDIVKYNGLIGIIIKMSQVFVYGVGVTNLGYPYRMITLNGEDLGGWETLDAINQSSEIKLVCKNDDVVINL